MTTSLPQHRSHTQGELARLANSFNQELVDPLDRLEAGPNISGLVAPIQFVDASTGQAHEIHGAINPNGLFEIIDSEGKTHPLMHPKALEACLHVAISKGWIDRMEAGRITQAHTELSKALQTPRLVDAPDGTQYAQVMKGFGMTAKRYKAGQYGAMQLDSQGNFLGYVGFEEIKRVMLEDAHGARNDVAGFLDQHAEPVRRQAGEVTPAAQARPATTTQAAAHGTVRPRNATVTPNRSVTAQNHRAHTPRPTHRAHEGPSTVPPASNRVSSVPRPAATRRRDSAIATFQRHRVSTATRRPTP